MYLKYAKVRNVKDPIRANWGDGIDIFLPEADELEKYYSTPRNSKEFDVYDSDLKTVVVRPNSNLVLPAGIKLEIPFGYAILVKNKSGIATNRELIKGAQLIDHGYSGEILIDLHNIGHDNQYLEAGSKLIQLIMVPVMTPSLIEVQEAELYKDIMVASKRGDGGFGSTGK